MNGLEKAQIALAQLERAAEQESPLRGVDGRAKLVVTLLYLVAVLSFPLHATSGIILFALYPVVASSMSATPYSLILRRSLLVLPLVAVIGVFNPLMHRQVAFTVGGVAISEGWLEFASITLRGLLSVQGVLVMVYSTNFFHLCRSLTRMGIPSVFATQLMFVYRYLFVLIDEAVSMDRARRSRSYGRKHYSMSMYGVFVGQLLLRTVERSRRIYDAMLARGFNGSIPRMGGYTPWTAHDTVFTLVWGALFALGRMTDTGALFHF